MTSQQPINPNFLAEPDLGYGQLFRVLVRRRWWLIAGLLIGLGLGGVAGYRDKKFYTSSLQLLVESNYQSRKAGAEKAFTDPQLVVDVGTQIQLLQSGKLVRRAAIPRNESGKSPNGAGISSIATGWASGGGRQR
jgi:polysaccharide biosynthesis transport protein